MNGDSPKSLSSDGEVQILCVGLMRTGLKTLRSALENLGYKKFYDQEQIVSTYELWDDVLHNRGTKETFQQIFQGAEVVMGMPTFCYWEFILEMFPEARVILTVRDEEDWWKSIRRAKSLMSSHRPGAPGAPLSYGSVMRRLERALVPSYHKFCEVLRFSWATTLGGHALEGEVLNEASVRLSYRKHNSHVKATLSSLRTATGQDRLLVYDVREGWGPLCSFLDVPIPLKRFPSVLHPAYFPGCGLEASESASLSEDVPVFDRGEEFGQFLDQESPFGMVMRREMQRGLLIGSLALTLLVGLLFLLHGTHLVELPVALVSLVWFVLIIVGSNIYVVMHSLVMRVPALVVVPMAIQSLCIACLLNLFLCSAAYFKELLVTRDHVPPTVLILSSRIVAIAFASGALLATDHCITLRAPLSAFAMFSMTNEAATYFGYEMLKYVSFPVQVMAKSCKLLPTMLMGWIWNGTEYRWYEYLQSVLAFLCVAVMYLSDDQAPSQSSLSRQSNSFGIVYGIVLLIAYFVSDSFTSQYQDTLYKQHRGLSQTRMMLGGNLVGLLITAVFLPFRADVFPSGTWQLVQEPQVAWRILGLSLSSALGQYCIYLAIRVLGPLNFSWIMTARQLNSVLVSLLWLGHGISMTKLICISVVFGIMSWRQLQKAMPARVKCCVRRPSVPHVKSEPECTHPAEEQRTTPEGLVQRKAHEANDHSAS